MPPTVWAKFSEYGLIGLILAVLFFILWKMLCWVMAFVKEITQQHNAERQIWLATLNKQSDTLTKISECIETHDKRANERGNYVREEHKEMIQILGWINGFKHE